VVYPQKVKLSIQSGTTASADFINGCLALFFKVYLLDRVWRFGALFLKIFLLGRVWQPGADYNDHLAQFKI
jgi:hypothetical protein